MQMDILVFHGTSRGYEALFGCPELDYASNIIYITVTQGKTNKKSKNAIICDEKRTKNYLH